MDDALPTAVLGLTRRGWSQGLTAFLAYAMAAEARAAAPAPKSSAATWVRRQDEIARALEAGELKPHAWMDEVELLARQVDFQGLMAEVRRSQLTPAPAGATNDPAKRYVGFLDEQGRPRRLAYGTALFSFAPRNVITPHGHRHMVSAHLVAEGALRVRNFDRLRDEDGALVIRPTRDRIARLGEVSTMSSERDNIHWFVPHGGPATTFDVIISGLDKGQPDHLIQAIDPMAARKLADGSFAAPIISFEEASRRYTADV
jgi:hypothetical protein